MKVGDLVRLTPKVMADYGVSPENPSSYNPEKIKRAHGIITGKGANQNLHYVKWFNCPVYGSPTSHLSHSTRELEVLSEGW